MKKAIITGATGMVGGIVLRKCLESPEIGQVISISRRASGVEHDKLTEVLHADFLDLSSLSAHFEQVDVAYFCLGVYTGQVPNDLFETITVDYTKVFADALKAASPGAHFCFLSGEGADPKEKSRVAFARLKGVAENYLIKQDFGALHIFRPAYIYPVEPRKEPNITYRIARGLYPIVKRLFPASEITSEQLAQAIFQTGLSDGPEEVILSNAAIKGLL